MRIRKRFKAKKQTLLRTFIPIDPVILCVSGQINMPADKHVLVKKSRIKLLESHAHVIYHIVKTLAVKKFGEIVLSQQWRIQGLPAYFSAQ